ncbi:MAG: hypothetical protein AAF998_11360 [Bacteroidota bacterium]
MDAPSPRIIDLWAIPRSASSAFERTFAQRSDTYFEPFFNVYHFSSVRQATRLSEFPKAHN